MRYRYFPFVLTSLLAGTLVLTGCPPKKKMVVESAAEEEPEPAEENVEEPELADVEIDQEWSEIPQLEVIAFGFDLAKLDAKAKETLKKNVAVLKKLPASVSVRVEGHCDDRGTIEYNIALGQRRANTITSYYVRSGLKKSRIKTISYGEERPLCTVQTEACWAKNRRGLTKVRNTEPLVIKAAELKFDE